MNRLKTRIKKKIIDIERAEQELCQMQTEKKTKIFNFILTQLRWEFLTTNIASSAKVWCRTDLWCEVKAVVKLILQTRTQ